MNSARSVLTGQLPFYLLLSLFLTWPVTLLLQRVYLAAVRRSMRHASGARVDLPPSVEVKPTGGSATLVDLAATVPPADASALAFAWRKRLRRATLAYVAGGAAYALVMATAELLADGIVIRPLTFSYQCWVAFWPAVLTVALVATTTARQKWGLVGGYFAVLTAIGAAAMPFSPQLTWPQVYFPWLALSGIATLTLVAYLSRRVRASGPLVLLFVFIGLLGTELVMALVGRSDQAMRDTVTLLDYVGYGAVGGLFMLAVVGFVCFAAIGLVGLIWIRRRYQAKHISDESLTVDSIWIMFAVNHGIGLVFASPWWFLAAPVSYAAFKVVSGRALARLTQSLEHAHAPRLLLLRAFSIGRASERFFDGFIKYWRRAGSLQMITGADFATRTIDPPELLEFAAGRLSRRFIADAETLDRRLDERDLRPDGDGRFRINEFFCHDNTWRAALSRLVGSSDAVLMDLRGFTTQNAGCIFELRELARAIPLTRVVFIVDERTDQRLLAESLGPHEARVWRCLSNRTPDYRQLLGALAASVTSSSAA